VSAGGLIGRAEVGSFPSTLYVDGPSEPLKAAFLAALKVAWAAHTPQSHGARVFRATESGVEDILAAFQGASLFSPRDLILVLDIQDLMRSEKKILALAAGLARPAGESCLVFVESAAEPPRKSLVPLREACAERWTALPPGRAELMAWGARRLARESLTAETGVLELLADVSEGEAVVFFNELDKLCSVASAGETGHVSRADATSLLKPVVGADLPQYLAAVAAGHPGLAARDLGRVLAAGVGEGAVLFALSNLVGGALGGWARNPELSGTLRRRLRPDQLAAALDAVYRGEAAWKSGRADVIAVLEQATRAVAGTR
jgi:DNA polymerase III delta subunit